MSGKERNTGAKRFNVVCGSEWLSRKQRQALFRDAKVTTIPSSLDTNIFKSSKTEKQSRNQQGHAKYCLEHKMLFLIKGRVLTFW